MKNLITILTIIVSIPFLAKSQSTSKDIVSQVFKTGYWQKLSNNEMRKIPPNKTTILVFEFEKDEKTNFEKLVSDMLRDGFNILVAQRTFTGKRYTYSIMVLTI